MGKVHKEVFEEAGHKVILSGRKTSPNLEEATKQADLTIVSVPIHITKEIIQKIAPHANAIMDFTGIKTLPIKAMLKYSKEDVEVGGLHPLYGFVESINGRSIVYCKTQKSGKKCEEIVNVFENAGAKIISLTPEDHDSRMALVQGSRIRLLETYADLIKNSNLSIEQLYEVSPPPTKILLDLISRQVDESTEQLYENMIAYNPFNKKIPIPSNLLNKLSYKKIRDFYGKELKPAQERARQFINLNDNL